MKERIARLNDEQARFNFVQLRLNEIKKQLHLITETLTNDNWALLKRMIDVGVNPKIIHMSEMIVSITKAERKIILDNLKCRYKDYDVDVLLALRDEYSELFTNIDSEFSYLYRELLEDVEKLCVLIEKKTDELTKL